MASKNGAFGFNCQQEFDWERWGEADLYRN
jgi:hypothetical protein